MRIGILTGGGDVPGLNPCIRTLVYRAVNEGHTVIGIRRGWEGLLFFDPQDENSLANFIMPLDRYNTRTIDRTGGTILHTSRTNPESVKIKDVPEFLRGKGNRAKAPDKLDFTAHVLDILEYLQIDVLVPIGGDDTLGYAARLHQEQIPIVAIPKTMDNDVFGTDYCIGFSTAITRSVSFIHQLRTSSGSHERLAVIELFGRYSGETCLVASYLSSVDRSIISEVPFDPEKLTRFLVDDRQRNPSRYAMVAISEGARFLQGSFIESSEEDAFGHKRLGGIGLLTTETIKQLSGVNTLYQQLSYLMRTGEPDSLDLMVAANFANLAMDLISHKKFGRMVALRGGCYTHVSIDLVKQGVRCVDVDQMYDTEEYRPKISSMENKPMFLY